MNKSIKKLVKFGIPNSWEELTEDNEEKFNALVEKVLYLDSLNDKEAFYLASHLSKSDLDGIGTSLCGLIQSAPNWPTKNYLYIDNFSDAMTELKHDAISLGGFHYDFTGSGNKGISISVSNHETEIFKIKNEISVLDLQFILALYLSKSKKEIGDNVIKHLMPIIQNCIVENKISKQNFDESFSANLSELEETYKAVVPASIL